VQEVADSFDMTPVAHESEMSTEPEMRGTSGDDAALENAVYVHRQHHEHASACDEARCLLGMPKDPDEASSAATPIRRQTTLDSQSEALDEAPDTEPSKSTEIKKTDTSSS
jgi:hypothetical protein